MMGSLPWPELLGALSGICFAVPPLRDQYGRWNETRALGGGPTASLRHRLYTVMKERRDGFSGVDTVMFLIGSILLCLSFTTKAFELNLPKQDTAHYGLAKPSD